jgi:hypothetical protein
MLEKESLEETVKTEKITRVHCDGDGCKKTEYSGRRGIWNDYDDDFETTTVSANLILGGGYVKYDFDVCPICFAQKIVPLFDGKGVKNRVEEIRDVIISRDKDVDGKLKTISEKLKKCETMAENAELLQEENRLIGESHAYYGLRMMIANLT